MWDWLLPPGSDLLTAIATWVAVAAGTATLALFCGSLLLRASHNLSDNRRRAVIERWRAIFAAATLSAEEARSRQLPRQPRWAAGYLLEEWNRIRSAVDGESADNLIEIAKRLGLECLAHKRLYGHSLHARLLAVQTLGHMADASEWDTLMSFCGHSNTALSATAAQALVKIDARNAIAEVMQHVIRRPDWPPGTVYRILKTAGAALITQPICNAILTSESATAVRLLRYVDLAQPERIEQLIEIVLRERPEPAVIAAAMRAAGSDVPGIKALAEHDDWYVRVQAAKLIGRVGGKRDLPILETLLADREWWVRYRAAQALVRLPFMGPNQLRRVCARQWDDFAGDMMRQAMAEVGLA